MRFQQVIEYIPDDRRLQVLAQRMMREAKKSPATLDPEAIVDVKAAIRDSAISGKVNQLAQNGVLRLVAFPPKQIVSLHCSLDLYRKPPLWHISMVLWLRPGQAEVVPQDLRDRIVQAFFGDNFVELPGENILASTRHYGQSYKLRS